MADWITRGKEVSEIGLDSIWQNGPSFLKMEESEWPIKSSTIDNIPEERGNAFVHPVSVIEKVRAVINIDRFSKYVRLLYTTARVLAVFMGFPSLKKIFANPSNSELQAAELYWIKDAQKIMQVSIHKNKFKRLNLQLNKDGLYIVHGRTEKWFEDNYNQGGLILMPHDHRFSKLYIEHIHSLDHLGVSATVAKVRRRFWITRINALVKSIRYKCVTCKKLDKVLSEQIMAPLPEERLKPAPVFHYTSLDHFGPLQVKGEVNKRSRGKTYGVIFTCLYTRAIYCDLSQDYSTDAFLIVLRRFVSIRGYPGKIYSDTGSQLVAANKELKEFTKGLDKDRLLQFSNLQGLEWHFCSPDAPWQNGTAEALIKSVKKSLSIAIGEQVLAFSELQTVLFEAANIVNERPIGVNPKNADDGSYLCPNDIILGRASARVPNGQFRTCSSLKRLVSPLSSLNDCSISF